MVPPFADGLLPPGVHQATFEEVCDTFGWNPRRRQLLAGLGQVLANLRQAGCKVVWLDGSFVTTKEFPGDFDLVWDMGDVDFELLDPVILDTDPPRLAQRIKFGADLLPNVREGSTGMPFVDFFQQDKLTGAKRGIVELRLEGQA